MSAYTLAQKAYSVMTSIFTWVERLAGPPLRICSGLILVWIGALHPINPKPIVDLLSISLGFLAFSTVVYVLGALEVVAGMLLVTGLWVRYVGLLTVVLFVGTLTIFFIAPAVTGFPLLNRTGQFLLKDFVLDSAALTVVARDAARPPSQRQRRERHHLFRGGERPSQTGCHRLRVGTLLHLVAVQVPST